MPKSVPTTLLRCRPVSLQYDFQARTGILRLAAGEPCTMDGCIEMFTRLDPGVVEIVTYVGGVRDSRFRRDSAGRWLAFRPETV